jgi:hypothetical protein
VIVGLSIYSDGFVADTVSSTDDTTAFLVELTGWMTKEFGLTLPSKIRKSYLSNIDLECDSPLINLNPRMTEILAFIESRYKASHEESLRFDFAGITVWTENVSQSGAPAPLKFERKIQAPLSANHYFSQAPLQTSDHTEVLNKLEAILKEPKG